MNKGAPQVDLVTDVNKNSVPIYTTSGGYFGNDNYVIYLQSLIDNFDNIQTLDADVAAPLAEVAELKTRFTNFGSETDPDKKIESCTSPLTLINSDATFDIQSSWTKASSLHPSAEFSFLDSYNSIGDFVAREILNLEKFWMEYDIAKSSTTAFKSKEGFYYKASVITFQNYIKDNIKCKPFFKFKNDNFSLDTEA
jgi:hypothetical protein